MKGKGGRRPGRPAMTRRIELRLTPQMYDSIREEARSGGYRSLPKYVRDRLFHARRTASRGGSAAADLHRAAVVCRSLAEDVRRHFLPSGVPAPSNMNTDALESLLGGISAACSRMEALAPSCIDAEDGSWS